jgi:hypothetical protein
MNSRLQAAKDSFLPAALLCGEMHPEQHRSINSERFGFLLFSQNKRTTKMRGDVWSHFLDERRLFLMLLTETSEMGESRLSLTVN